MSGFTSAIRTVRKKGAEAANTIGKKFQELGPKMERVGRSMTLGLTLPIAGMGAAMIKTASDAEETRQKFDVVFGDISKIATQTSEDLQKSFGLSSNSANKLLGDVGDILTGFGFTQKTALSLSKQVNELAVDLASFTNFAGGAEGASKALTKALLGEAESVKALGIVIRQDTEEYKNLVAQIQRTKNVGLVQAKALAALRIATEQSKNAIGDFARTQDSFANQTRQLKEDISDLATSFGKELIPIAKSGISVLRSVSQALESWSQGSKRLALGIGAVLAGVGPLLTGLGFMVGQIKNLSPLVTKLTKNVKSLATVLGVSGSALSAYVAGLVALGVASFKANQRTEERISAISDEVKSIDSVASANKALIATEKEISLVQKQMSRGARGLGKTLEDLRQKREELITQRDALAVNELNALGAKEMLNDALRLNDLIAMLGGTVKSVNISKPFIEAKKPINDVLLALDMIPVAFQELSSEEILSDMGNLDLGEKIFPPGSLGAMEERLQILKEKLRSATDPTVITSLQNKIKNLSGNINNLTDTTSKASEAGARMGNMLGDALSQALLHSKDLLGAIGNLVKQFASRTLMKGLSLLLAGPSSYAGGFFKTLFGGLFHSGGVVGGTGERMVKVRSGEGVFTKGQMAAMGMMATSGGGEGMSEARMQKSFEKALTNTLNKLGPNEIYALSRKGQAGF